MQNTSTSVKESEFSINALPSAKQTYLNQWDVQKQSKIRIEDLNQAFPIHFTAEAHLKCKGTQCSYIIKVLNYLHNFREKC